MREEKREKSIRDISGGDGREDPPVPMPNTEVKLSNADNSWLATAREDRKLPGSFEEQVVCEGKRPRILPVKR